MLLTLLQKGNVESEDRLVQLRYQRHVSNGRRHDPVARGNGVANLLHTVLHRLAAQDFAAVSYCPEFGRPVDGGAKIVSLRDRMHDRGRYQRERVSWMSRGWWKCPRCRCVRVTGQRGGDTTLPHLLTKRISLLSGPVFASKCRVPPPHPLPPTHTNTRTFRRRDVLSATFAPESSSARALGTHTPQKAQQREALT